MADLSPVEIVALSKCVKDKEVTEARAKIPEPSAHQLNFVVHIQGTLTRAGGVAAGITRIEATTRPGNLTTLNHFCQLLRELKIGPRRLDNALRNIAGSEVVVDDELLTVFRRVAEDFPEVEPARDVVTPAKSGNISVTANVTRV